ncbi:MAG TPA: ABC transporter ATP-binding protein [Ruania sp.]|nr:ABC transporter ATP-binding protein [Ruania sp.]
MSLRELIFKRSSRTMGDSFWALRNISFDVRQGEAIGVVGRNGQGKSTLLKIVAGVLLPDEGQVRVNQGVAPLIEITGGFAPDLTGRENIYLAAGLHGMTREQTDDRFEEIVDFSELEDFLDTPFRHYSSGMKVRLAFAVISRLEDPILLVDEVLAVGDKAFRKKCHDRIEELLAAGRTLFLVSHSDGDLKKFCHRGLYLRGGQMQADGPINEILEQYTKEG